MKSRELLNLGLSRSHLDLARTAIDRAVRSGLSKGRVRADVRRVLADPIAHLRHPHFSELAAEIAQVGGARPSTESWNERTESAPWHQWGSDLEPQAVAQMANACRLPVSISGALMPDAHLGYGLPIGGVLATDNTVIPYAVGVDIACRMRLSVLDMPAGELRGAHKRLERVLEDETSFGVGAEFRMPKDHEVMDEDWGVSPITAKVHGKARRQLGTSGSGNHFVEFGALTLETPELGLKPGTYLALLSHSGSRGPGNTVASHYSRLALEIHPELPRELRHLAWLDLDSDLGGEYWAAMQLMGRFAAANHQLIHHAIVKALRAKVRASVENHHNFAWIEEHHGRTVVVHRKGATPASDGQLGVIPGSMATPGFVVRGKGSAASLMSAAHGAGRVMSRKAAKRTLTWSSVKKNLAKQGVTLLSAGLDEAPDVYKNIHKVMAAQSDLVEVIARFDPKIVKMAPPGERPED
ncbi:MAG: RtcB family protein [Acidobacteria bacterium]|nr:RtcB family protein [Acidobacteriota bacterium]